MVYENKSSEMKNCFKRGNGMEKQRFDYQQKCHLRLLVCPCRMGMTIYYIPNTEIICTAHIDSLHGKTIMDPEKPIQSI